MSDAERSTSRLGWLIVVTSVLAVLASLAAGAALAQRVARPIYELQLKVATAAERMRIEVRPRSQNLGDLATDITALVRRLEDMDTALVEQRRRLIQSEKLSAVGEVTAKLAHEILNPLAGMKTATQVLSRSVALGGVDTSAVHQTAQALDREIGRVSELMHRLVDYTRPLAPNLSPLPVETIIRQAVEAAQPALKKHRLEVSPLGSAAIEIPVDPLLMTQALANLLNNAAQAMSEPGRVSVGARIEIGDARDHLVISVADEGPGLSPAVRERLFHPFVTTKDHGHGLGLAVCHNIVSEHGGHVIGRNRADRSGAVFEVWLPCRRPA